MLRPSELHSTLWEEVYLPVDGIQMESGFVSSAAGCPSQLSHFVAGFFHRSTIPNDITNKVPNPELWGKPTALLSNTSCPPNRYFWDHQVCLCATLSALVTQ